MILLVLAACVPHLYTEDTGDPDPWVAPENDWPLRAPPEGLRGEGFAEGQVVPDFRLSDPFGQQVSLWQFYGEVVALDLSTMWCAPCQDLAGDAEETYQDYRDQGFLYVTVLAEDAQGGAPDQADLQQWVEYFDLTSPVLSDAEKQWSGLVGANIEYPRVWVVGRDLRVHTALPTAPTDAALRTAVEAVLSEGR